MYPLLYICSYIIQKHKDPSKAHQVKLEVVVKALKWLQIDMDVDEVNDHILSTCYRLAKLKRS